MHNHPSRSMKTSTLIRRFLPYFKKYRGMLFLDLVCAALTTVCDLVLPLIVRDVTDLAANNLSALTVSFVLRVGGIYVLLRIVDALANFYMASRGHIMGTFIERDMRNDLFAHLQTLGFAYYSNAKVGQIMARITSDLFEVTEFAHHCPEEFFIAGIKIVIPFIILMGASPALTLIIFAMLPLMIACTRFFNKRMRAVYRESRHQVGEINAQVEDSLLGIRVVKSFANEQRRVCAHQPPQIPLYGRLQHHYARLRRTDVHCGGGRGGAVHHSGVHHRGGLHGLSALCQYPADLHPPHRGFHGAISARHNRHRALLRNHG